MLSLTRGRACAIAVDREGKKIYTIHITDDQDEPDIICDDVMDLIHDEDIQELQKSFHLGKIEMKLLKRALKDEKLRNGLNAKLTVAMNLLVDLTEEKLKKEIDFRDDPDVHKVIPLIGQADNPFDRSIALIGPSGSGKTWLAKEIIKHDVRKRPAIIFSKIRDDESLQELKKLRTPVDGKSRMIQVPLFSDEDLINLPTNEDLKNSICLFDDLDSFIGEKADYLREYRNSVLECGRHHGITVLSTSHILLNREKTKTVLNECEMLCLFPGANRHASFRFLQSRFGLKNDLANKLLTKCIKAGRSCVLKLSAPNAIIYDAGVCLI